MKIYLNGRLVEKAKAVVSVFDHGLLYGDGVFEGIRAYHGRVFRLREHLDRLFRSAKAIHLAIPLSRAGMERVVLKTLRANRLRDAYIRLVVTRGPGDLGLDPRKCSVPTVFCITDRIVLYPEELYRRGMEIVTVATRRNNPEAQDPRIKSLNYLNNILAKVEATRRGAPEAIMLSQKGFVAECTGDNIFFVSGGTLWTPPVSVGALEGITRRAVMDLARRVLRMRVREQAFKLGRLYVANECFLTGTAAEVIPVRRVDGRKIGDGHPGRVTLRLMREFRELTLTTGAPIPR